MSEESEEELQLLREINDRQKREEEKKAATIASNQKVAKGCLFAAGLMVMLGAGTCVLFMNEMNTPEMQAAAEERARCGDETSAFTYSKEFVKRKLRSPSTAEFAPYSGAEGVAIETIECGRYKVHAYVDASNSFGATTRSRYSALMIYDSEQESWSGEVTLLGD